MHKVTIRPTAEQLARWKEAAAREDLTLSYIGQLDLVDCQRRLIEYIAARFTEKSDKLASKARRSKRR